MVVLASDSRLLPPLATSPGSATSGVGEDAGLHAQTEDVLSTLELVLQRVLEHWGRVVDDVVRDGGYVFRELGKLGLKLLLHLNSGLGCSEVDIDGEDPHSFSAPSLSVIAYTIVNSGQLARSTSTYQLSGTPNTKFQKFIPGARD